MTSHLEINASSAVAVEWTLMQLAVILRLFPIRMNAGTVHGWVQPAGNSQNRVANRFPIDAPHGIMRQQPVLRIYGHCLPRSFAGLLECSGQQQETNLFLDGPTLAYESLCQIIQ